LQLAENVANPLCRLLPHFFRIPKEQLFIQSREFFSYSSRGWKSFENRMLEPQRLDMATEECLGPPCSEANVRMGEEIF